MYAPPTAFPMHFLTQLPVRVLFNPPRFFTSGYLCLYRLQQYRRIVSTSTMPPKKPVQGGRQSTLGYVKTQMTLGCALFLRGIVRKGLGDKADGMDRNFFTLPAGTKPPVKQQTVLKSTSAKRQVLESSDEDDTAVTRDEVMGGTDEATEVKKDEKVEKGAESRQPGAEETAVKPKPPKKRAQPTGRCWFGIWDVRN